MVTRMLAAQGAHRDSINAALLQLTESYPVGIRLDEAIQHPGSDADLVLREGDRIIIPEYDGTVKISGDESHDQDRDYCHKATEQNPEQSFRLEYRLEESRAGT